MEMNASHSPGRPPHLLLFVFLPPAQLMFLLNWAWYEPVVVDRKILIPLLRCSAAAGAVYSILHTQLTTEHHFKNEKNPSMNLARSPTSDGGRP